MSKKTAADVPRRAGEENWWVQLFLVPHCVR
jgi:hypothetical protein